MPKPYHSEHRLTNAIPENQWQQVLQAKREGEENMKRVRERDGLPALSSDKAISAKNEVEKWRRLGIEIEVVDDA